MAKKFFYLSLGILALAAAYHLGAARTEAQGAGAMFAGIAVNTSGTQTTTLAITSAGDVYARHAMPTCSGGSMIWGSNCEWTLVGNVLDSPIALDGSTWAAVKGSFR